MPPSMVTKNCQTNLFSQQSDRSPIGNKQLDSHPEYSVACICIQYDVDALIFLVLLRCSANTWIPNTSLLGIDVSRLCRLRRDEQRSRKRNNTASKPASPGELRMIHYCIGEARAAMKDCVFLTTNDGCFKAMNIIHKVFWRLHSMAESFFTSILIGGSIAAADANTLKKLCPNELFDKPEMDRYAAVQASSTGMSKDTWALVCEPATSRWQQYRTLLPYMLQLLHNTKAADSRRGEYGARNKVDESAAFFSRVVGEFKVLGIKNVCITLNVEPFGRNPLLQLNCSSTELDFRTLAPNGLMQDEHPCKTLENRAPEQWASGLFSNCTFDFLHEHNRTDLELRFTVDVNTGKLPEAYQNGLSYDFQTWYINRLLNGNEKSCLTTSGHGQPNDGFEFILVAPFDEEVCQKITNKKFYEEHLKVKNCNLLEKSDAPIDGHILGKYNITLWEKRKPLVWFEYHDIYIFFLRELNGPEGACDHNGYWARPLFNYAIIQVRPACAGTIVGTCSPRMSDVRSSTIDTRECMLMTSSNVEVILSIPLDKMQDADYCGVHSLNFQKRAKSSQSLGGESNVLLHAVIVNHRDEHQLVDSIFPLLLRVTEHSSLVCHSHCDTTTPPSMFNESCTFTQDYPQETHLQVNLKVRVDTIKLPKDAPDDSSYDFLMWYLNWLINGGKMRCMTTFGEGQKEDIFAFILVAPYAEDFCEKYINKTFHNDKMTVTSCELLKKSENTVGGTILGKYQLVTIETWSNSQDDAHVDLRTTFLQEQNGPDVGCKYNGYWAPVQLLFTKGTKLMCTTDMPPPPGLQCLVTWQNRNFVNCSKIYPWTIHLARGEFCMVALSPTEWCVRLFKGPLVFFRRMFVTMPEQIALDYENDIICIFQTEKVFVGSYLKTRSLKNFQCSSHYFIDHEIILNWLRGGFRGRPQVATETILKRCRCFAGRFVRSLRGPGKREEKLVRTITWSGSTPVFQKDRYSIIDPFHRCLYIKGAVHSQTKKKALKTKPIPHYRITQTSLFSEALTDANTKNAAIWTKVDKELSSLNEYLAPSTPGPLAAKKFIQLSYAAIKTTTASLVNRRKILGRAVSVQKANPTIRRLSEDRSLDARKLGHSSSREEVRKRLPDGASSADPKLKAKPFVVIAPCAPESTPRQTTATPDSSFYSTTADPSNSIGSDALEEASLTWTERPKYVQLSALLSVTDVKGATVNSTPKSTTELDWDHDSQSLKPDHGEPDSPSYTQLATLIAGDSDDHTGAKERRLQPNKPYTTRQIRKLLAGFK
ncbi:hypothetical protein CLF_108152, partial [Clonorchis sinensis]